MEEYLLNTQDILLRENFVSCQGKPARRIKGNQPFSKNYVVTHMAFSGIVTNSVSVYLLVLTVIA